MEQGERLDPSPPSNKQLLPVDGCRMTSRHVRDEKYVPGGESARTVAVGPLTGPDSPAKPGRSPLGCAHNSADGGDGGERQHITVRDADGARFAATNENDSGGRHGSGGEGGLDDDWRRFGHAGR